MEFREGRCSVVGAHSYGNSVTIKNNKREMGISTEKVKLVKYGK
ncbi:hypothetical protein [Ferroplasma sp.]|nr:hypothetical protein [Ferroplasma sp.]